MKPDFVISVGDVTNNGLAEEYAAFIDTIDAAKLPWFVAPGNHEYRDPNGHTSADGPKRFKKIFGKQDFYFDHCGWRFIGMDVTAYDLMSPSQLKWLEKTLEGFDGRAVLFMHYPPGIVKDWEEGYFKTGAEQYMKILETHKVPYSISGHIHVHDSLKIGPTTYIITGGGGGGTDTDRPREKLHSPDGGPFHHFIFFTVNGDNSIYAVVKPNLGDE